jgi:hypothetical protein
VVIVLIPAIDVVEQSVVCDVIEQPRVNMVVDISETAVAQHITKR